MYRISNPSVDVSHTAFFGFLDFVFVNLGCEPVRMLLGFMPGPMMEENLRLALQCSSRRPEGLRQLE